MSARVYYNERDPAACEWLRELMDKGLIPKGAIDERSIAAVQPEDLSEYTQCHFFAGNTTLPCSTQPRHQTTSVEQA
jgi:DNA (cytosine-5)-methyltransferase 1